MKRTTFCNLAIIAIIVFITIILISPFTPKSKSSQDTVEKEKTEQKDSDLKKFELLKMDTSNSLEIYTSADIYFINIEELILISESGIFMQFEDMSKLSIALKELTVEDDAQISLNNTRENGLFKQNLIDNYSK